MVEVADDEDAAERAEKDMASGSAAWSCEDEEGGIGLSSSMLGSMPPLPF